MEIYSTTDYSIFKFREDNRAKISSNHVEALYRSILRKNMLYMKEVIVNENFEIMDGQHRVLAARKAGVPVFYRIERELSQEDMVDLNISRNWLNQDYLNCYSLNNKEEYKKLYDFCERKKIPLKLALTLSGCNRTESKERFKSGGYKFNLHEEDLYDVILETFSLLKKLKAFGEYGFAMTYRFWDAMIYAMKTPGFNKRRWLKNIPRLCQRMCVKATTNEYIQMISEVYNWGYRNKLDFSKSKEEPLYADEEDF